jgi:copper chaperone NosL
MKLSFVSRILFLIASLALLAVLYLPIWRIELDAPQYPEGLVLQIYADKLAGDVDVVNGLNHYIGMRTLHADDFIEFTILPYIFIFFAGLGVLFVLINRRSLLYTWLILFLVFSILAFIDFWRWEYDYGHNLDPKAAIQVPGMSYQPPLIGFKQLLNFGAFSIPDKGGWIFIVTAAVVLFLGIFEMKKSKSDQKKKSKLYTVITLLGIVGVQACNNGPVPIKYGADACAFCKMTITDIRFGCEIETVKGKVFKFDDISCLLAFSNSDKVKGQEIACRYLIDFIKPRHFIKSEEAFILRSDRLRTPMNSELAAFSSKVEAEDHQKKYPGEMLRWQDIKTP